MSADLLTYVVGIREGRKMKGIAIFAALITLATMSTTACNNIGGQGGQTAESRRTLVVYFSATGNTRAAAKMVAEAADADLWEIEPEEKYSAADLDWRDETSRSTKEMKDPAARPALKASELNTAQYDTIYIGYPIWWYVAPRIINSFVESYDLEGKVMIPFATSGSSDIAGSVKALRETYPDIDWRDGLLLNHADYDDVEAWVKANRTGVEK